MLAERTGGASIRWSASSACASRDSTMDRYSDMLLHMGLLLLYARLQRTGWARVPEKAGP